MARFGEVSAVTVQQRSGPSKSWGFVTFVPAARGSTQPLDRIFHPGGDVKAPLGVDLGGGAEQQQLALKRLNVKAELMGRFGP